MRIMVTGGAGFIGSNFILYWLQKYPEDLIVNFDALTYAGNLENVQALEKSSQYQFVKGDITDPVAVKKAMTGCDVVVHFAAESHVDRSIQNPAPFFTTNIVGTQVLLEEARQLGNIRFHHVSTDEVFGSLDLDSTDFFSETTPYNPRSPYSASKAGSDHIVRAYFHTYGLPTTITNCSNNFGPYQFPEKLIPLAITNILEGQKVPVYGDGLYVRDWLHVEDHCRAIDLVLKNGVIGGSYCVGGLFEDTNNLAIVKKILAKLGKDESSIEFVTDRPGHDRRYAVNYTKISEQLGYKPLYGIDEWLDKTIEWYKTHQAWWKRVKSGAYQEYYKTQYRS